MVHGAMVHGAMVRGAMVHGASVHGANGFGDDCKDYFNQLAMAASEPHKLGISFPARPEDLPEPSGREPPGIFGHPEHLTPSRPPGVAARLLLVSEKRLGFGTHCASNLAQRFSDAPPSPPP